MQLSTRDKKLISNFFTAQPVKRAYLFGSYARQEGKVGSDIDLLVELDYSKPIGYAFVQMVLDLEGLLGRKVDLVADDSLSRHIRPFFERDKLLIYEAAA